MGLPLQEKYASHELTNYMYHDYHGLVEFLSFVHSELAGLCH